MKVTTKPISPPLPPPRQIEITLDQAEADVLVTILAQINDDAVTNRSTGPFNKLVRALWKELSPVTQQIYEKMFENDENPKLKAGK